MGEAVSHYDDALDLPRDENGRVIGYGVGKEASMRDWSFRKEQCDFEKLVVRLRVRKYQKANRPKINVYRADYEKRPDVAPKLRTKQRQRRAKKYRARAPIFTCRECGSQWCKVPWARQHRKDFCSRSCKARFGYREKKRAGHGA